MEDAVKQEIEGPGKLLGYRALNQKLRVHHGIKVPRPEIIMQWQNLSRFAWKQEDLAEGESVQTKIFPPKDLCGHYRWTDTTNFAVIKAACFF